MTYDTDLPEPIAPEVQDGAPTALPEDLQALIGLRVHGLDPAGIVVILEAGDDEHFAYPRTTVLGRGQELVLDEKILLASLDRAQNSIWRLDEDEQRMRFNGTARFGWGEYPVGERRYDLANAPDNSRLVQKSTTIANYDRPFTLNNLR